MTDEKALQTAQEGAVSTAVQDFETLKAAVGKDLSNSQLKLAVVYANSVGADLFARQIYPIVMDGRLQFLTSIDFLRVIAQRSGEYEGQGEVRYGSACDCQGEPFPVARKHPEWAEVPIYRRGFREPVVRRAYFHEYLPLEGYKDNPKPKSTWVKMPHVLIAKVSEALGIRVAFPNDVRGLYTNDEMEQADQPYPGDHAMLPAGADPNAGTGQGAIEIPPDPEKPEWAQHEVKVREAPDGLRTVKVPEWYKGEGADHKTIEKLEIRGKYGRRNVTVILLGPVAVAADDHLELLEEGATVVLDGAKYEYEWQEGKPKALQVRNATRLAIDTGGQWLEFAAADDDVVEGQAEEVETPDETANVPAEPPAPEPEGKAPSAEPSSSSPEAGTNTGANDSGPTTPTNGDLTEAAGETFADLLEDADVDPARGGNPQVGDKWEQLPVLDGPTDQAVSFEAYFASGELTEVPGATGKHMYEAWLTSAGMDHRIHVLMSAQVAATAGVERLGAGEQVYVRGIWKHPRDLKVVLADVLRPA